jgi:polygalacturonase
MKYALYFSHVSHANKTDNRQFHPNCGWKVVKFLHQRKASQDAEQVLVAAQEGDATGRIQNAIDHAAPKPVRVVLQRGVHVSGGLRLRSHVELHLAEGAELRFVPDYDAYMRNNVGIVAEGSDRAMIAVRDAESIALTGTGRMFCDSAAFVIGEDPGMSIRTPAPLRPRMLVAEACRNVRLHDIAVVGSPMWTLHFVDCDDVDVNGVSVDNDTSMPNTDGLVIDSCRKVVVRDCTIRTADDGIVLKTSARPDGTLPGPCHDISVSGCEIESRSCALKIGTESFSDFEDIAFEDCRIVRSNRGLGIFSRDGGVVRNVRFSRIALDCRETPPGFWGSGEGICLNALDRRPSVRPAGIIADILFEDITGTMQGAFNLIAERPGGIADIVMRNVSITQSPGSFGTARAYDLRPTPADLEPVAQGIGRQNSWRLGPDGRIVGCHDYLGGTPGLFARNVAGLGLDGVTIARPSPLPQSFNTKTILAQDSELRTAGLHPVD